MRTTSEAPCAGEHSGKLVRIERQLVEREQEMLLLV